MPLLSAGDELPQRHSDGCPFRALAADLNRSFEEVWIDR
jgi:hypothetical protein